jgi:hypothetical protein
MFASSWSISSITRSKLQRTRPSSAYGSTRPRTAGPASRSSTAATAWMRKP